MLEESVEAVRLGEQRRDRVDGFLRTQIPSWSLFPLVQNLGALRGLDTIASAGLAAAIGDPSRFASAPDFMAYLGLVPSEHSSGPKRRMGAITKSGDVHARTLLIEAAHSYRFPARIARRKLTAVDAVPEAVREIAWKAQTRLMPALSSPHGERQAEAGRRHRNRARTGRIRLVHCLHHVGSSCEDLRRHDSVGRGLSTKSTGRSRALRRQPLKATGRRAARPEQTSAPIELRYVTVDRPCPEADNPKVSTPASSTRRSAAASVEGSAG